MSEFFTSTNVPTFDPARSTVPGRRYANGPTLTRGPISASTAWLWMTFAPSWTAQSISVVCDPIVAPAPTRVTPRRVLNGSSTVSWPTSTPTSTTVAVGRDDGHPGSHQPLQDLALGERVDLGQPDPVVDAERLGGVGQLVGDDGVLAGPEHRQHVGEVELALGVVGPHLAERIEQRAALEGEDPGVHLADRELELGGVARRLRLHHALDGAVRGADDAAIAGRVLDDRGDHRGGGAITLVRVEQSGEGLRA